MDSCSSCNLKHSLLPRPPNRCLLLTCLTQDTRPFVSRVLRTEPESLSLDGHLSRTSRLVSCVHSIHSLPQSEVSAAHFPQRYLSFFHDIVEPEMQRLKPSLFLLAFLTLLYTLLQKIRWGSSVLLCLFCLRTCHISMIF